MSDKLLRLAVLILEKIGERFAKRGDMATFSDLMYIAALIRQALTAR